MFYFGLLLVAAGMLIVGVVGFLASIPSPEQGTSLAEIVESGLSTIEQRSATYVDDVWRVVRGQ